MLGLLAPASRAADVPVRFETHIRPILETRCLRCHGEGRTQGGLDLRRRFTILKGGDSGTVLVPGKPDDSLLVQKVTKGEMPPAKEEALSPRQRELIRQWVADGAPLVSVKEPPLVESEAPSRVSAEDRRFWAFIPPRRPAVPEIKNRQSQISNPIDAFLLAKLQEKGLSYNPESPREVLLRRVTFDLTGLPPTEEELERVRNDRGEDWYERLVDRLLASPAYGERWGRHWLDLAGYADSDGYLDADRLRPQAWRYRDYVIRAINEDVPYDRFVTEQLAGDELSDWRAAKELTPEMIRQLTATGFLRTALDPTYPGYTEPNEIHQVLSDTLQIVGTTFLGMTIQCARCHSHKFDPVSQRDYYALQAVFLPALDPARWQPSEVRGIPMNSAAEQAAMRERAKKAAEQVAALQKQLAALKPPEKHRAEIDKLKAAITAAQAEQQKLTPVVIRGLMDLDGKPSEGHILRRGDYSKPGAAVAPGVPEILAPAGYKLEAKEGHKTTGRRLALARWLTDPAHPLTARVQVNRLWAHHFGRGLVPTVANFGRSGMKPSHPELLDWLALRFVSSGWSLKEMHRLILTSSAYRQCSAVDAVKLKADPDNILLGRWRPRRLEGEALRDSVLAVSDRLRLERYGPPGEVARKGDGSVEAGDDPQGNRRSIYLIVRRSLHMTMLELFDTPLMEVNCPERSVSTVPLQALAMLHAPFSERNAAALAERILRGAPADEGQRIAFAWRLVLGREPRASEVDRVRRFLMALAAEKADSKAAWTQVALVLLNSNEFLYIP
jgi:hypothetical protein